MLNRLIDASIRHPWLVLLLVLLATALGLWRLPALDLDAFPDVTNVQVTLNTEAKGLAAEDVEKLITYPVESVLYALPDVEEVRSVSKTGLSVVTVVFKEGVDIYFARQLVLERLQAAQALIPEGVGQPSLGPNTSGLGQVFQYLLRASPDSGLDAMSLRSLNDYLVKLMLMPVDGVTDVLSFGGQVRQFQVQVDPDRLLAFGISFEQLADAIEKGNQNAGGWYLDRGQEQLVVRGAGWYRPGQQGLDDIADTVVQARQGRIIRVRDLAEVGFGGEVRQGAVSMTRRQQGQVVSLGEVVSGIVLKRMGANTQATIAGIQERLPAIAAALPAGVTLEPVYDQSDLVAKAVATVTQALAQAFVFILVVLALFLVNLRATFLVLVTIPLALLMSLTWMSFLGISANLMSLGGLAIAIGMLVDGAVVMVEGIFREFAGQQRPQARKVVGLACRQVARPSFFAALIVLLVFTPLFALQGVEGKLFIPMALSMMLALATAVLLAMTLVPALAVLLFAKGVRPRANRPLQALEAGYGKVLSFCMARPKSLVLGALLLVAGTLMLLPRLGTEFVPELEEGTLNIRVTLAPSASLDTALAVAGKLEQQLLAFPEVDYALSRVGRPELGGDPEPVSNIEIYLGLKPLDQWQSADTRPALQAKMEAALSRHPGLLLTFSQPIATRVDELLSGVRAQLAIKLFGPDLEVLARKGADLEALVKAVPGTRDVALEQLGGEAQLVVRPKRERLSQLGMTVADLMALVSDGIGGRQVGQVVDGNERYDVQLRLAAAHRKDMARLNALWLTSPQGYRVQLRDIAELSLEQAPIQIRRDDVQRRLVVQANVAGRDMGSVVADINAKAAAELALPAGYYLKIGGQFENQARAQARLMLVVPLSLGLIALLLYWTFGSMAQAALVMSAVPLALVGGIWSLYLSGQYLSVPGSVGFITLFGVAVLNGVVLVDAINQRLAAGMATAEAVQAGALSRLRPVLMTALTSALGLIPMLLATGVGAEIQKPLATVVVGGLVSATVLTLLLLPALYLLLAPRSQ